MSMSLSLQIQSQPVTVSLFLLLLLLIQNFRPTKAALALPHFAEIGSADMADHINVHMYETVNREGGAGGAFPS